MVCVAGCIQFLNELGQTQNLRVVYENTTTFDADVPFAATVWFPHERLPSRMPEFP